MSNVIPFITNKCPVGQHALHREYGLVEVISADGQFRLVMFGDPNFDDLEYVNVDVRELRELDFARDSMPTVDAEILAIHSKQT